MFWLLCWSSWLQTFFVLSLPPVRVTCTLVSLPPHFYYLWNSPLLQYFCISLVFHLSLLQSSPLSFSTFILLFLSAYQVLSSFTSNLLILTDHFPPTGAGGPGLSTYQVSDHPHRHQAREHPGVRGRGVHSQVGLRGNAVAEDGAQASWLPRWVESSITEAFLTGLSYDLRSALVAHVQRRGDFY